MDTQMEGVIDGSDQTQKEPKHTVSRKKFKQLLMPSVGDILCEGLFRVEYVNYGKFWFSSSYRTIVPEIGAHIKIEDRMFKITNVNPTKRTFTSTFQGFEEKQPTPIEDAPIEEEETVKLI